MPRKRLSVCSAPGCIELTSESRCARHRAEAYARQDAKRPSSAQRHGRAHPGRRRVWKQRVAMGTVRCRRGRDCFFAELVDGKLVGGLIYPGEPWDLGHDETRESSAPEHRRCNRATKTWNTHGR